MVHRKQDNNLRIPTEVDNTMEYERKAPSQEFLNRGRELKNMMKKARSFKLSSSDIPGANRSAYGRSADSSSPNYMKTTSSWEAKSENFQASPKRRSIRQDRSSRRPISYNHSVASPHKPVIRLRKNSSLKPLKSSMKRFCETNLYPQNIARMTCSSSLKDSKFPSYLEFKPGGNVSHGISMRKICPYTYCSLNGRHHEALLDLTQFMSLRRRLLQTWTSTKHKERASSQANIYEQGSKEIYTNSRPVLTLTSRPHEISNRDDVWDMDFFIEIFSRPREMTMEVEGSPYSGPEPEDSSQTSFSENGDILCCFSDISQIEAIRNDQCRVDDEDPHVLQDHSICPCDLSFRVLSILASNEHAADTTGELELDHESWQTAATEENVIRDGCLQCSTITLEEKISRCLDDAYESMSLTCLSTNEDGIVVGGIPFQQSPIEKTTIETELLIRTAEICHLDDEETSMIEISRPSEDRSSCQNTVDQEALAIDRSLTCASNSTCFADLDDVECLEEITYGTDQMYYYAADEPRSDSLDGDGGMLRHAAVCQCASLDISLVLEEAIYLSETQNMDSKCPTDDGIVESESVVSDNFLLGLIAAGNPANHCPHTVQVAVNDPKNSVSDGRAPAVLAMKYVNHCKMGNTSKKAKCYEQSHVVMKDHIIPSLFSQPKGIDTETNIITSREEYVIKDNSTVIDIYPLLLPYGEGTGTGKNKTYIKGESTGKGETVGIEVDLPRYFFHEEDTCVASNELSPLGEGSVTDGMTDMDDVCITREDGQTITSIQPNVHIVPKGHMKQTYNRIPGGKSVEDLVILKKYNSRAPQFLLLQPSAETERVDLRHKLMVGRKNSEEWMLDYALRQTIDKLGAAQKRPVALLIEAFETLMPLTKCETPHTANAAHVNFIQACS